MKFKHGSACTKEKNYGLTLQINCDSTAIKDSYHLDPTSIEDDECHPTVIMNSQSGCPVFSMPALWRWSDSNNYVIGAFFMIIGGLMIYFGNKYQKITICFIASFGVSFLVLLVTYGLVMPNETPQYIVWISVLMSFGVGAGAGYGVYY
jgi:hypothetical protein